MKLFWLLFFFPLIHASTHVIVSNRTFTDKSAAFGPSIPKDGQIGYMSEPMDPTGCTLAEPPCSDWIALVKRGGCSFITKVRQMQKSGAVAVVVGDPIQPGWITMYAPGDTSDISIPSVFIARHEYNKLLLLGDTIGTPMMTLLQYNDYSHWPFIDMIIIAVVSPCIMLFFILAVWKMKQRSRRYKELAPVSVVSQLTVKLFHIPDKPEEEPDGCAICLEDYEEGSELRLLPCNHQFHTVCVDAWLTTQKKLCPICKRDITRTNNEITYCAVDYSGV
ncbi:hypothetical protein BDB01DRAFT_834549 [Pilobolus umbonatus]|nr:hypothetical protein BDB01DRAFT_834549 [Pilobolus umbonatus]